MRALLHPLALYLELNIHEYYLLEELCELLVLIHERVWAVVLSHQIQQLHKLEEHEALEPLCYLCCSLVLAHRALAFVHRRNRLVDHRAYYRVERVAASLSATGLTCHLLLNVGQDLTQGALSEAGLGAERVEVAQQRVDRLDLDAEVLVLEVLWEGGCVLVEVEVKDGKE